MAISFGLSRSSDDTILKARPSGEVGSSSALELLTMDPKTDLERLVGSSTVLSTSGWSMLSVTSCSPDEELFVVVKTVVKTMIPRRRQHATNNSACRRRTLLPSPPNLPPARLVFSGQPRARESRAARESSSGTPSEGASDGIWYSYMASSQSFFRITRLLSQSLLMVRSCTVAVGDGDTVAREPTGTIKEDMGDASNDIPCVSFSMFFVVWRRDCYDGGNTFERK